ncbi:hypothetical protein V6N11_060560 [Hibiscus sabdariffa]|uniref:BTB domain-containing protein n=1 Tax=Hibiscus sabdariffa TaxID=183260 RepID=A0ABR2QQP3_9ROSI
MGDSKVETISRLAQWRIDNFGPCSYKKSDPFKVGLWNWHLSIEKNRYLYIRLFPEPSRVSKEQPPYAKFILRISNVGVNRRLYISPVHDRQLRTSDDFFWPVDSSFHGRFIIDVEFLDLRICPINVSSFRFSLVQYASRVTKYVLLLSPPLSSIIGKACLTGSEVPHRSTKVEGGESVSIWPIDGTTQSLSTQSTLRCLARMLDEGLHADVTIQTSDGTLRAHKAVLSASSPVFESMFHHNLKEKASSTIHIEDMSLESCTALLSYLYGTIKQEDFWKYRLALLGAANKYDIADLKDACEESLLEDINSQNVLERLQEAWLYQLTKLKKGCMTYLFDFAKIYDVREEINNLFRQADRELMLDMFQEVLTVWKPSVQTMPEGVMKVARVGIHIGLLKASLSFLFFIISSPLLSNALSGCNGPCRDLNDCSGQLICINGKCNDDPDLGTHICHGSTPSPPASGNCQPSGSLRCGSQTYPTYTCSPPVTSSTRAKLTNNDFSQGGDGGGPSECDEHYHENSELIVALSTGWYNGGSRCGKMILIRASNGRSVKAKVVDECDSRHGCDEEHAYQPPCKNNIVDGSDAVWSALGLNKDVGIVDVTWSMA